VVATDTKDGAMLEALSIAAYANAGTNDISLKDADPPKRSLCLAAASRNARTSKSNLTPDRSSSEMESCGKVDMST
jgi:hypothetical protein